jgi:teichuronic acid exporter
LAAVFFQEPHLVNMVRALGLVLLFNFLGMVPYSLLTKELDLKRRSLAEAMAATVGVIVSITAALAGQEFWALVYGQIVKAILRNLGLWFASGWMPGLQVSFDGFTQLMGFGFRVFGASGIKSLSNFANVMMVGKFLGSQNLGLFTMADSLGNNPVHKLTTSIINQVSFPVFSKLQNNTDDLKIYFLKISQYLALLGLPIQVGMALVAYDLVVVLLSEKWVPMVSLLQVFCVGWIFSILQLPSSPLLTAKGQVEYLVRYSGITAVLMGVAFLVGVQFGLIGVAMAWISVFPATRLVLLGKALGILQITPSQYLQSIFSAIAGILVMIAVLITLRYLTDVNNVMMRLLFEVIVGMLSYIVTVHFSDRKVSIELGSVVRDFVGSIGIYGAKKFKEAK